MNNAMKVKLLEELLEMFQGMGDAEESKEAPDPKDGVGVEVLSVGKIPKDEMKKDLKKDMMEEC